MILSAPRGIVPYLVSIFAFLFVFGCGIPNQPKDALRDLHAILADTLRVAVLPGPLTWEEKNNDPLGLEAAILQAFADSIGAPVVFKPFNDLDSAMLELRNGTVDLIAGRLREEPFWRTTMGQSRSYARAGNAIAYLKEDPWYGTYRGHEGARIKSTEREMPDEIWCTPQLHQHHPRVRNGHVSEASIIDEDELLAMAALGKFDAVLVDASLAMVHQLMYPHMRVVLLDDDHPLVFGRQRQAHRLARALDHWLKQESTQLLIKKLSEDHVDIKTQRLKYSFAHPTHMGTDSISAFDHYFMHYADTAGVPWEMLAALAFKESAFDPDAGSHAGATGLMQLMPNTHAKLRDTTVTGVEGTILIAARYLRTLDRIWKGSVPNRDERMHFILASYNIGLAHVMDAQRLAAYFEMDSTIWQHHVERALLLLSKPRYAEHPAVRFGTCHGYETFLFVREVMSYEEHYAVLGIGQ